MTTDNNVTDASRQFAPLVGIGIAILLLAIGVLLAYLERVLNLHVTWWLGHPHRIRRVGIGLSILLLASILPFTRKSSPTELIFQFVGLLLWAGLIIYPRHGFLAWRYGSINVTVMLILAALSVFPYRLWLMKRTVASVTMSIGIIIGMFLLYGNVWRLYWGVTFSSTWFP